MRSVQPISRDEEAQFKHPSIEFEKNFDDIRSPGPESRIYLASPSSPQSLNQTSIELKQTKGSKANGYCPIDSAPHSLYAISTFGEISTSQGGQSGEWSSPIHVKPSEMLSNSQIKMPSGQVRPNQMSLASHSEAQSKENEMGGVPFEMQPLNVVDVGKNVPFYNKVGELRTGEKTLVRITTGDVGLERKGTADRDELDG